MSPSLQVAERPARGEPSGLLVLHHGRGTGEHDLLGLADLLDPGQRLRIVAPRAPLAMPGTAGFQWYVVPRVGYPDPATFQAAHAALAELHDHLWQTSGLGPERTVLGGFSMGCVMSYALGLDRARPIPAGILALSGFVPTVEGWAPDLAGRAQLPVLIAHGRGDPVIGVELGRRAAHLLGDGGLDVEYRESGGGHHVNPPDMPAGAEWLERVLPAGEHE